MTAGSAMDQVFGAQQVMAAGLADRLDRELQDMPALARVVVLADRDGVEHRGDAGADDLHIVGNDGGEGGRPDDAGPWRETSPDCRYASR